MAANENSEEIATTVNKLIQEAYELLADTIDATKATDDRAKRQRVDWTDRHRLHVLLEAAEDTRRSLPVTIVAPWFLAELRATLDIVRRWQEKPCWQDIEKSLNDAESFAHTIAMLHIAEHLEWGGHKVEVVAEGEKPSPDLMLRAIGGSRDTVVIECYQPSALCGKPSDLSPEDAEKIVKKAMEKAKRQVGSEMPGILAICGYNQSSRSLETLRETVENRLSKTDRTNLCGIWLVMLGVEFKTERDKISFRATRSAQFIRNPSYFGRVDIEAKEPSNHPNLIKSPLMDITTDRLLSGEVKPMPVNHAGPTLAKEARTRATKVKRLNIIEKPKVLSRSVVHGVGNKVPPLFIGEGNIDYQCGQCGTVLAKCAWALSMSNIVIECPRCHSYNEIPTLPYADYPTVQIMKGNYNFSDAVRLKAGRCLMGE